MGYSRFFWWTTSLVALALAGCGGHAYHTKETHRQERAYHFVSYKVESVLDDVDASDTQRDRVHAVKDRIFDDALIYRDALKDTRYEALDEWRKDDPSPEVLHKLVDQRTEELRRLLHGVVDGMMDVHQTLTPEQRDEIVAMIEEKMEDRD